MTGCATCEVTDELLFTCEHCGGQFCAAHELPHHACAGFTREGRTGEADGWEFVSLPSSEGSPATVGGGETPKPAPESTPRPSSDRDAAKERRPDRETRWVRPPGKGLPHERGGEHPVFAWMREQSYPAYVAKVGGLSLLLTCAYYAGFVAVTYGLPR